MTKRPFQFHLSTALIAMIVGGAFLGLNLRYPGERIERNSNGPIVHISLGFPFVFYVKRESFYDGLSFPMTTSTSVNGGLLIVNFGLCAACIYLGARMTNRLVSRGKLTQKP